MWAEYFESKPYKSHALGIAGNFHIIHILPIALPTSLAAASSIVAESGMPQMLSCPVCISGGMGEWENSSTGFRELNRMCCGR